MANHDSPHEVFTQAVIAMYQKIMGVHYASG